MDTLGRRIFGAFVKQRHLISLALVLGAMLSFTYSIPASANNHPGTGQWVNRETINYNGMTFSSPGWAKDGNNNVFRYTATSPIKGSPCSTKPYIEFAANPTESSSNATPGFYDYPVADRGAGEDGFPTCNGGDWSRNNRITLTNTNLSTVTPAQASCRTGNADRDEACVQREAQKACQGRSADSAEQCIKNQTDGNNVPIGSAGPPEGEQTDDSTPVKCPLNNSLGWIVCPLSEVLGNVTVAIANAIESLLRTESLNVNAPSLADDEPAKAVYTIWSYVRNLANIVLVVAVIFIIYSQATSFGLSNYGIKKMLPKLIIAAIAINISYFISALLIDIFNLLGAGVAGLFTAVNNVIPNQQYEPNIGSAIMFALGAIGIGATGFIASGAAAAGTTVALGTMWPMALLALATIALAVIAVIAVLIFRLVAISLLVIVSPLAFAAWLLPNTEDYFKKWLNFFQNLLIMYPIAMAIIYGSILGSNLITNVIVVEAGPTEAFVMQIFALLTLAIPLFSMPFLFKFAGAVGSRIGGGVNNFKNRGPIDGLRKKAQERRSQMLEGEKEKRRAAALAKYGDVNAFAAGGRNRFTKGMRRGYANTRLIGAGAKDREDSRKEVIEEANKQRLALRAERQAKGGTQNALTGRLLGGDGAALQKSADDEYKLEQRTASAKTVDQRRLADRITRDQNFVAGAAGVGGDAAARRIRAAANATLFKEQTERERQKAESLQSVEKFFDGDFNVSNAWAASGGDTNHQAYRDLNLAGQAAFNRMRENGLHERAESFDAALRFSANAGSGDAKTISAAFGKMAELNYDLSDINGTAETIRSVYRSKGRGDLVKRENFDPQLQNTGTAMIDNSQNPGGFGVNWKEVKPETISRHAVDQGKNPEGFSSLVGFLKDKQAGGQEYTRNLMMKLDTVEDRRAKEHLEAAIAQAYVGQPRPNNQGVYTRDEILEEMRVDFQLNPGGGYRGPVAGPQPAPPAGGTPQPSPPPVPPAATGGYSGSVGQNGIWVTNSRNNPPGNNNPPRNNP